MTMDISMWDEPAEQITGARTAHHKALAEAAVEPLAAFVLASTTREEFTHRLALSDESIARVLAEVGVSPSEMILGVRETLTARYTDLEATRTAAALTDAVAARLAPALSSGGYAIVTSDGKPLWGMVYDTEEGAKAHHDSVKGRTDDMVPKGIKDYTVKQVGDAPNRTYDKSKTSNPFQPKGSKTAWSDGPASPSENESRGKQTIEKGDTVRYTHNHDGEDEHEYAQVEEVDSVENRYVIRFHNSESTKTVTREDLVKSSAKTAAEYNPSNDHAFFDHHQRVQIDMPCRTCHQPLDQQKDLSTAGFHYVHRSDQRTDEGGYGQPTYPSDHEPLPTWQDDGIERGADWERFMTSSLSATGSIKWKGETHFGVGYLEGKAPNGDIYEVYFNPNMNPTPCAWVNYGPKGDTGPNSGIAEGRGFKTMQEAVADAEAKAASKTASLVEGFSHDMRDVTRVLNNADYKAPAAPKKRTGPKPVDDTPVRTFHLTDEDKAKPGYGKGSAEHERETQTEYDKMHERERKEIQRPASKTANWVPAARAALEGKSFQSVNPAGEVVPTKWLGDEIDPDSDGIVLDTFTASMLIQIHDALNPANAERFANMPILQAVDFGWKLVEKSKSKTGAVDDERPLPGNGFSEGDPVETEWGPGRVVQSTGRSIVIRLENVTGETISLVNGTPGMDRLRAMNAKTSAVEALLASADAGFLCEDCGKSIQHNEAFQRGGSDDFGGFSKKAWCRACAEKKGWAPKTAANPNFSTPDGCMCPPPRDNDPRGDRRTRLHWEIRDDYAFHSGPFERKHGGPGSADYAMMNLGDWIGFGSTPDGPGLHIVEVQPGKPGGFDMAMDQHMDPVAPYTRRAAKQAEGPKGDYANGIANGRRDRESGNDPQGVGFGSGPMTDYEHGYWEGYGLKAGSKTAAPGNWTGSEWYIPEPSGTKKCPGSGKVVQDTEGRIYCPECLQMVHVNGDKISNHKTGSISAVADLLAWAEDDSMLDEDLSTEGAFFHHADPPNTPGPEHDPLERIRKREREQNAGEAESRKDADDYWAKNPAEHTRHMQQNAQRHAAWTHESPTHAEGHGYEVGRRQATGQWVDPGEMGSTNYPSQWMAGFTSAADMPPDALAGNGHAMGPAYAALRRIALSDEQFQQGSQAFQDGFADGYIDNAKGRGFQLANGGRSSETDYAEGYYEGFDAHDAPARVAGQHQAVNEGADGAARYQNTPDPKKPDWITEWADEEARLTKKETDEGRAAHQPTNPFADTLTTVRQSALRHTAVGENLEGFEQNDDFSTPVVTPHTTRPRVLPNEHREPTIDNPPQMGETPGIPDMGGGFEMTDPAAVSTDPMQPSVDQMVAAKIARIARRVLLDNPGMDQVTARHLAAQTVARFPEMVKVQR